MFTFTGKVFRRGTEMPNVLHLLLVLDAAAAMHEWGADTATV